jgi:hypothetical protein
MMAMQERDSVVNKQREYMTPRRARPTAAGAAKDEAVLGSWPRTRLMASAST